ncbi:glycosyltransferase family 2 protein [Enterococcus devriesei]|uniref:glycosyltransferase family 2 protein n=1 Tax=Enterococcus devriesei TaxID=319970 RepID=UPI00288F3BB5|nr:glycosyltransferase family 2 protein [Enterococcus devriesei]MDT2820798.1 glycosyltransferase family 2 protein [Enterococcus devriesei]
MNLNLENKLSIVVPVYNVETTIERAVQSLFENEYKNVEVLLIDDGSTDTSGTICDKLSKKSDNIYCYHKENGGLSSARNYGLKKVNGNFIAFLDSDDYYLPGCIDRVMNDFQENDPDIVCFGLKKGKTEDESIELVEKKKIGCNTSEAVELLFRSKATDFYAWNKVFKRHLFNDIEFPEGKLYEDMVPIYHAFKKAKTVDILDFTGIFYFQNSNSIVYQDFNPKQYDNISQRKILLEYINIEFPELSAQANNRVIDGYLSTGFKIANSSSNNIGSLKTYKASKKEVSKLLSDHEFKKTITITRKIAIYIYILNAKLYRFLYKLVLKK